MKTASNLIQTFALTACLAASLGGSDEARMPGVRKALQTMEVFTTAPAGKPAVQMPAPSYPR